MPKKFLMGLVPMLVAVAVAMPSVAQAEPHYYRSGTLIPEGEKVPILEWGTLSLTGEPVDPGGPVTCEYAAGGSVENPAGGGAGVGNTAQLSTYKCTNAGCPPGKIKVEEGEYEKEFAILPTALPWSGVLIEELGMRTELTGVQFSRGCYAHGLRRGTSGQPGYGEQLPLAEPAVCVTSAEKKLRPLIEPGANSTVTSKLTFDVKSGAVSCAGGVIAGRFSGKLKVIAYKESELITTRNP